MSHGGRGQVSARSVRRARRERKETYHAAPTTRRKIHKEERHPIASRPSLIAPSRASSSSASAARGVRPLSSVIARSRFAAFHALRRRERAPALEAFHLSSSARGFVLPCPRSPDERGFPRALPLVHPPARLVGEVVLRARALVVVLDGGVGFGVGRREARPRAGVRGPPRGRGSPPERRAPTPGRRAKPRAVGPRPRAVIGPAAEAFGGRARRRGLRAHARRHSRDIPRDAAHRRAQRGHVHRSVGIDARDDLERPTLLQAERCRRQIHLCDFADVWFLADRRLDQSSPRRRWRQARR